MSAFWPGAIVPRSCQPITAAGWPLIYPRREAKDYGTQVAIEGVFAPGEIALVLDDVATRGDSKLEAFVQDLGHKTLGREAREGGVEGELVEVFDPEAGQAVGAGLGVHQAEGWALRREELAGVRLERDDAQGRVGEIGRAHV